MSKFSDPEVITHGRGRSNCPTSERSSSQSDWLCGDSRCGYQNSGKRDKCNKCDKRRRTDRDNKPQSGLGREAADKSKGLFSADDWTCKNCGNINWARRGTCNVCNTTRVNKMGERTGYGGGFMEREQVVEYKRRKSLTDSDDEYDDFGRRKKNPRRSEDDDGDDKNGSCQRNERSNSSDRPGKSVPLEEKVKRDEEAEGVSEEDEEEEESGDDADLSKYNIGESEDDDDEDDGNTRNDANGVKKPNDDKSDESDSSDTGSDSSSSTASSTASSSSASSSKSSDAKRQRHSKSKSSSPGLQQRDGIATNLASPLRLKRDRHDRSRFETVTIRKPPSPHPHCLNPPSLSDPSLVFQSLSDRLEKLVTLSAMRHLQML